MRTLTMLVYAKLTFKVTFSEISTDSWRLLSRKARLGSDRRSQRARRAYRCITISDLIPRQILRLQNLRLQVMVHALQLQQKGRGLVCINSQDSIESVLTSCSLEFTPACSTVYDLSASDSRRCCFKFESAEARNVRSTSPLPRHSVREKR